ncbi:fumarate reductase/succinate dehydrogenase flavoprotein subunit [Leyella lascolaii]|jgi:succinate dehydrogenase / fumarate reductase flavoprotein subunit|uniref:succinate dehydrogenase n=1 Tax=Leyella lascolaii TaxID=1776379 RepID=A0AAW7JEI0_9BACT|nr:fumarate reductase/succinate dehydrogenase flavoprotein subunit [Leyella lascolaii]MDN0021490.1 fumarate reductase/succinate dehydrogenase flavoprotein subunit [Leyella lascolaii]MDN0023987.1 fumarate reductase/succinate dehydrogenase flavoprotein subunit [Leyella lascolaii]CCZ15067.1 fumarate reductase flavoprotein subunit [Prevotella sp. CAG:487]
MAKQLDSKIPAGPVAEKWTNYKAHQRLVNPKNKLKLDVIVVGTGLAGASAAASLGEMGFNVLNFCIQDSPRRAHSIAAQGGINAAKNYQNDGDSVYRLFYDTVKGGDYRAREANVYRLAEVSNNIIDQCVAQGVPFAREYGGMLANRSFGGAQVSRTFYAKGQTGQQLLLGAYSALSCQIHAGRVKLYTRYEMEDVVIVDGRARGIIAKNLVTGKLERFSANAVVIGTGGYGNTYFLSTNAMGCNCTAAMACYRKGAYFANPSYVQIHPTCIPVHGDKQSKLTLMSESLRNDGRIWVPKKLEDAKALQAGTKKGSDIPEEDRDYYLERRYPAFGNLVPRDVASRAAKERCDKGYGVNNTGLAVFLDFSESIERLGIDVVLQRYGNLFDMYEEITDVNPGELANEINGVKYYNPMMIFPAVHYTMGGIWVDYELMTTIKGLFAIGECNFSDHGANRLGASALMQGLADGYFVLPYTIQNYLADQSIWPRISTDLPEFDEAEKGVQAEIDRLMNIKGKRSVDSIHKELGHIMWEHVGMGRTAEGLKEGLELIKKLRKEFETNLFIPGSKEGLNTELDKAIHLRDFITMGELIAYDALSRNESCGGHFREEYQTEDGEAKRDDENFFYVGCWEYQGDDTKAPELIKEPLEYEAIKVQTRNYKN